MDSPDAMEEFPGLFKAEKRKGTDSDYNESGPGGSKKDMMIGKRKDKKDKKDKDKGYAALEEGSSDEASPCKAKKSKAFLFSKSKDKRKDKENINEKGESSKSTLKPKVKLGFSTKHIRADCSDKQMAENIPIFGVDLQTACQRGKCHDGILIPLPVRQCIDYIEIAGLNSEHVYKARGQQKKTNEIKQLYNFRKNVNFAHFDIPTICGVLKLFLRELPGTVFTADLLIRFEEAAAILNTQTRTKHMKLLLNSLPEENRSLLGYLTIHFNHVLEMGDVNKMTIQSLTQALCPSMQTSAKLLQAVINHAQDLFPDTEIIPYKPPLDASSSVYPDDPDDIKIELNKLDSALTLIHWEMQHGYCSSGRLDYFWEIQRIHTDLKRKLKKELSLSQQNVGETTDEVVQTQVEIVEPPSDVKPNVEEVVSSSVEINEDGIVPDIESSSTTGSTKSSKEERQLSSGSDISIGSDLQQVSDLSSRPPSSDGIYDPVESSNDMLKSQAEENLIVPSQTKENAPTCNKKLVALQMKNQMLNELIVNLGRQITTEYQEIEQYKWKLNNATVPKIGQKISTKPRNLAKVRALLHAENRMLEIKKMELVRKIVECEEQCADLRSRILTTNKLIES